MPLKMLYAQPTLAALVALRTGDDAGLRDVAPLCDWLAQLQVSHAHIPCLHITHPTPTYPTPPHPTRCLAPDPPRSHPPYPTPPHSHTTTRHITPHYASHTTPSHPTLPPTPPTSGASHRNPPSWPRDRHATLAARRSPWAAWPRHRCLQQTSPLPPDRPAPPSASRSPALLLRPPTMGPPRLLHLAGGSAPAAQEPKLSEAIVQGACQL